MSPSVFRRRSAASTRRSSSFFQCVAMGAAKVSVVSVSVIAAVAIGLLPDLLRTRLPVHIDGSVQPGFEKVRDVFIQNFEDGWERDGASLAVFVNGTKVIDLWGGYADQQAGRKWKQNTMSITFSTTKAVAAVCVAMLVERGRLRYDDLVSSYWPGFAKHGKGNITVQMALSHEAGLGYLDTEITEEIAADHHKIREVLENETPKWEPGRGNGYHAYTFGWIVDQIVRHADEKHRGIGQFLREEIAEPYDIDYHIGLPVEEEHRVARITVPTFWERMGEVFYDWRVSWYFLSLWKLARDTPLSRTVNNPSWLQAVAKCTVNNPEYHRLEQAAALGIGNARSLATLFDLVATKRILSEEMLNRLQHHYNNDTDLIFDDTIAKGHGFLYLPLHRAGVDKLEAEDSVTRDNKQLRRSFTKRCHELYKQIDEHKNRIRSMKKVESTEVQRMTALEQLDDLQERLLRLAPERDHTSSEATSVSRGGDDSSRSMEKVARERATAALEPSAHGEQHETPVMVRTPQPEVPALNERRVSVMYDDASEEDDGEDDDDNEEGQNVDPEEAKSYEAVEPTPPSLPKSPMSAPQTLPQIQPRTATLKPNPPVEEAAISEETVAEGSLFVALAHLPAAEQGDLSVAEGELLKIVQTRPDGWWTARNAKGESGLVPKTYLRQATTADEARSTATENVSRPPRADPVQRTISAAQASVDYPQPFPSRPARCLGDAQEMDPHLSFACHLTPRLSHSNIGFHDLYWNYGDDKLRKRRVRVSKLVRLVRLEGMPRESGVCLVRTALYDRSRKTGRQIVSNVHTIKADVNNRTWTFNTRTDTASSGVDYGDFVVRSNYNMADVVLLIEASHVIQTQSGLEERSLGILTLNLISKGDVAFNNRTYSEMLRAENIFDRTANAGAATPHKIVLKVLDVPQELVPLVDSMPDVLIFNPMFVRLYFFFRRFAGVSLLRDRDNHLSAEMVPDPLLALFPSVADQPDMMDQLRNLWNTKLKNIKNKPEADQAESFFRLFMNTTYCIHKTAVMPPYRIWDTKALAARHQILKKCEDMLREHRTPSRFLLTEPCRPINVYDYSFDLLGRHALD